MKIFDIENNDLKFKKYQLQKNILLLFNNFGRYFIIKYKNHELPFVLFKKTSLNNKRKLWTLQYNQRFINFDLIPVKITFSDYLTGDINNNCYINNINKLDDVSGSDLMTFVMLLLKKLYVKDVYIHDGTRVKCGDHKMDLSLFKLIEKKETFYMRFGFNIRRTQDLSVNFSSNKEFNKYLFKLIDRFRKIKNNEIHKKIKKILDIFGDINKDRKLLDELEIIKRSSNKYSNFVYKKDYKLKKIKDIQKNLKNMQKLIPKKGYLYETLNKYFNKECKKYIFILNNYLNYSFIGIYYKKKKIQLNEVIMFQDLEYFRYNNIFMKSFY